MATLPFARQTDTRMCDDAVASGDRETDAGGDATATAAADQSPRDAVNGDAVRDTYVDTLNLWVRFLAYSS